jgi:hypothetical protein
MRKSSQRLLFLVPAALALAAGAANYLLPSPAAGWMAMVAGFGRGQFADGCWCVALCLVHAAFSEKLRGGRWVIFSLPFFLEGAQGAAILPGTFDWNDMGAYALISCAFIPFLFNRPRVAFARTGRPVLYTLVFCGSFGLLALASATQSRTSYRPKPQPCVTHKGLGYSPVLTKINLSGSYTMKDLSGAQRFAYDYLFEQLTSLSPNRYKLSDGVTPNLSLDITINTDSYQHYGATLNMYVSDGSVYYSWNTDYITIQKLYDDIASKINVFVSYGWCTNCPSPCNP